MPGDAIRPALLRASRAGTAGCAVAGPGYAAGRLPHARPGAPRAWVPCSP